MGPALNARLAALERRIMVQHPAPCAVRFVETTPEQQEEVLGILLEAGVLRFADDGALLRLADGGEYVPCSQ